MPEDLEVQVSTEIDRTDSNHVAGKSEQPSYDRFNKIAGGIQSLVVAVGIIVGGVWALIRFDVLFEARAAISQLEKIEAEAASAKRSAAASVVINVDISAKEIEKSNPDEHWVVVELSLINTGNTAYKLEMKGKTRFYIAKVIGVSTTGIPEYSDEIQLQFDYPDITNTWFMLRPGAVIEKIKAIQKVDSTGLYLARFSATTPDSKIGEGREYSAENYFYVD